MHPDLPHTPPYPFRLATTYFLSVLAGNALGAAWLSFTPQNPDAFLQLLFVLRPLTLESALAAVCFLVSFILHTRRLRRPLRANAGLLPLLVPFFFALCIRWYINQPASDIDLEFRSFPHITINEAEVFLLEIILLPLFLPRLLTRALPAAIPALPTSPRRRRYRALTAVLLFFFSFIWIFSKYYSLNIDMPVSSGTVRIGFNGEAIYVSRFTPRSRVFQFYHYKYDGPLAQYPIAIHYYSYSRGSDIRIPLYLPTLITAARAFLAWKKPRPIPNTAFPVIPAAA